MKKIIKTVGKTVMLAWYHFLLNCFSVKKDIIVFNCSIGKNYTGNPRYIYEYMVEKGLDTKYRCIWIFENTKVKIPGNANIVKFKGFRYFYYMAVSGVWIFDCRQPEFLVKRKECHYIQTWHGTPLKRLALDMTSVDMSGEKDIESYKEHFYKNAQTWDYLLSQNAFSTQIFRRCFGFEKEILEIGYPRNDILFNKNTKEYLKQLKMQMGLPEHKKIILYAPTWRDNEFDKYGNYKFATMLDFGKLQQNLSEEYIVVVKYHYLVQDKLNWDLYKGFVYSFGAGYDIVQLYLLADILVTDYSSVMFDYSILRRPMLFYCYDYDNYKDNLRGFYFDFAKEAPGPISRTTDELIVDISEKRYLNYKEKYEAFINKFNHRDNGKAAEEVVKIIEKF